MDLLRSAKRETFIMRSNSFRTKMYLILKAKINPQKNSFCKQLNLLTLYLEELGIQKNNISQV